MEGELSAHVITVSEFSGKKITCTIECIGHDHQNLGIVNTPAADQWDHFVRPFFKRCSSDGEMRRDARRAVRVSIAIAFHLMPQTRRQI
jgi:phosphotransacetylase